MQKHILCGYNNDNTMLYIPMYYLYCSLERIHTLCNKHAHNKQTLWWQNEDCDVQTSIIQLHNLDQYFNLEVKVTKKDLQIKEMY